MTRQKQYRAVLAAVGGIALGFSTAVHADTSATWDGSTNNWSSAADWSSNPNYPNNGTPVGSLYDVTVNSGTITLNVNPTIQILKLNGGTISGSDSLTILGLLTWSNGTLGATAETADGGIDFHGTQFAFLNTGTLTNPAGQSATIGATGGIFFEPGNGATFNNGGTLTATNGDIYSGGGATSTVNNSGTFDVNEPGGAFNIGGGLIFNNSGSLNVQAGELLLAAADNGSTTGTVSVSSGATIAFTANYTFSSSSTLAGAGAYYFAGGTQTLNTANYNVTGTTYLTAGTLDVGVNENIQGPLVWSDGTLTPTTNVTVTAKSGIDFHGTQYAYLNTGTLTNPAGQSATLGATGGIFFEPGNGATFNNGGTLTATNGDIYSGGGATSTVNNSGTFDVNEPGGAFNIGGGLIFNNSGSLNVQAGELLLAAADNGSTTGTVSVSSGATIAFTANYTFSSSSTLAGAGAYYFSGGTQTLDTANYNVTGTTYLTAGTLDVGVNENIQGPLVWTNGTLTPAANVTVTAKSGIDFHGNQYAFLNTGTLTNPAGQSATIGATGNIFFEPGNGATFNNAGTLTATNGNIFSGGGATSTVNNSGTFKVNEPSGTFSIGSGLQFNNTGTLMIQGGTLAIASPYSGSPAGTVSVSSTGALTASAKFTQPAGITNNGVLVFNATGDSSGAITGAGSLTIGGGTFQLDTGSGASSLDQLTISAGSLDITNNHMFINYGAGADPIASVAAWIKSGYAGGAWDGAGTTSSSAAANSGSYGIGYADSADPGNPAGLATGTVEIKYTLLGDANLDGAVNSIDFAILASNFNKSVVGPSGWDQGDFNYDGHVNSVDFAALATNFNKGANQADIAALEAFASANGLLADVPEPASTGSLVGCAIAVLARRRRRAISKSTEKLIDVLISRPK